ncbi:MAG: hypothetical protein QOI55_2913 [Actinomycetota bacterium]|nr:hypothetical protein [Actinomycetota bacterium]
MRYLYRVDDDRPFAYAPNRRDFFLVSDDTLWAHESHNWLLSASSSVSIVHRIGTLYYDADTGLPLYYETGTPPVVGDDGVSVSGGSAPPRGHQRR